MLTLWDAFSDFDQPLRTARFSPAVDIHEEDSGLVLRAEVPGFKQEELDVQIDSNILTLRGERKGEKNRYHVQERSYGSFTRRFHLPDYVDTGKVEAALSDGVLTLRLPKLENTKPRRVQVKVSGP